MTTHPNPAIQRLLDVATPAEREQHATLSKAMWDKTGDWNKASNDLKVLLNTLRARS